MLLAFFSMYWKVERWILKPNVKGVAYWWGWLGYLWTKAQENDIGILNNIKQRLKDIELQRWLSEVNNDVRKDANQKNKLRTLPENLKQSKIINVKIISIRSPTSDTR